MAEIFHPSRVGPPPSAAEVKTGQAVYGRTVASFAHNLGALLGARFKRSFCVPMEMADPTQDNSTVATIEPDYPIRWRLSPEADAIYVGLWCVAEPDQSSPPSVTVSLWSESGVLIDPGVTWSEANGLLPISPARRVAGVGGKVYGVMAGQDHYIETGWVREAIGGAGGGVRQLAGSDPGLVVEVRFALVGVRGYSATIAEAITGRLRAP